MENSKWLRLYLVISFGIVMIMVGGFLGLTGGNSKKEIIENASDPFITVKACWQCPKESAMPKGNRDLIKYGKELIKNTSAYLGPKGSVARITNGMNCQNCHLEAGAKPWGNNYFAVYSTYPKYRARSGSTESIEKRVNDCIERSLNGKAINAESKEMKAIVAYMAWLGTGVAKGVKPEGCGIVDLEYMASAASPARGKTVYEKKCQSCHTATGEGLMSIDGKGYQYPPLWGKNSFNTGAGLYRISRLAGYVKNNMPQGASYRNPQLTDEEAWNVAAYINSMERPQMDVKNDWPDISDKPVDHPFGPYTDAFTEAQHKYGPFAPIKKARETQKKKSS